MTLDNPIRIEVRFIAGAHHSNTVLGKRASSKSDYRTAAWALCEKLFEGRPFILQLLSRECGRQVFEAITAKRRRGD